MGTTDLKGVWGTPFMFGRRPHIATDWQIDRIVLDFHIFPALENGGAQSGDFGSADPRK